MSQLANDFGISDVGLAKRCKAVDVPIPYRGYWARVAAGQSPHKLPLPKYRTPSSPASAASPAMRTGPKEILRAGPEPQVRFGQPAERPAEPQTPGALMAEAFQQRVMGLKVSAATSLCDTCAAVRRTASFHKLPGRGALKLTHDETSGPIINVEVSKEMLERALLFADRLIRTAEGLGWTLEALTPAKEAPVQRSRWERAPTPEVPKPLLALLRVEGEPLVFRIEERLRREPRVPTPAELAREKREYFYHAPRTQDVSTGKLRVIRLQTEYYWGPERKTWFDRGGKNPVECQIPNILYGFFEGALELQEKRAEREREAQR